MLNGHIFYQKYSHKLLVRVICLTAPLMTGKCQTLSPKTFRSRKPQQADGWLNPVRIPSRWLPCNQEMADPLKKTFGAFYRVDKESSHTFHPRTEMHMANPIITELETHRALAAINPNKESGFDGFFPKALKT